MSTHTATMSDPYSSPINPAGFFRKLVMLLLFIAGIVALMALFDFYQRNLPEILMMVFAVASIAFAVGIGSRTVFYEYSGWARAVVASLLLPLGLFAVGFFTGWRIGIGPLEPWLQGKINWYQLSQLAGGFFVTILALTAWWKPAARSEEFISNHTADYSEQSHVDYSPQQPHFRFPQIKPIRLHLPESWTRPRESSRVSTRTNGTGTSTSRRSRTTARSRSGARSAATKLVVRHPDKPVHPKRSRRSHNTRRRPELQFSVHEEHRCPYCLDEVKRNDPRGVKECEICHSWHHADCWNITGMCQVPHLNQ